MTALALITAPLRRRAAREAAGAQEADDYITDIHAAVPTVTDAEYHAGFRQASVRVERMASDTDIRAIPDGFYVWPQRELSPAEVDELKARFLAAQGQPLQILPPRPRPYVPEWCHCGKGRKGHIPDWVTEILHHATTAETVEAESMLMGALTPDVLAELDQAKRRGDGPVVPMSERGPEDPMTTFTPMAVIP